MRSLRRGWTLHEMIISLAVTGAVLGIAVHAALGQLRFFHGVGEVTSLRGQLAQATLVPRALVWGSSPVAGDFTLASDTALELSVVTGSAVVCESAPGWVIVPAPEPQGNTLTAFAEAPQADDRIAAFIEDSTGATWMAFRTAGVPTSGAGCPFFPSATAGLRIDLVEQLALPAGTVLRFLRPMRLSVYRASDGRWYLGARDWNGSISRFNTVQPLAGPVDAPVAGSSPGFRFEYLDFAAAPLENASDTRGIAGIRIVARGTSLAAVRMGGVATTRGEQVSDSAVAVLALRNIR